MEQRGTEASPLPFALSLCFPMANFEEQAASRSWVKQVVSSAWRDLVSDLGERSGLQIVMPTPLRVQAPSEHAKNRG